MEWVSAGSVWCVFRQNHPMMIHLVCMSLRPLSRPLHIHPSLFCKPCMFCFSRYVRYTADCVSDLGCHDLGCHHVFGAGRFVFGILWLEQKVLSAENMADERIEFSCQGSRGRFLNNIRVHLPRKSATPGYTLGLLWLCRMKMGIEQSATLISRSQKSVSPSELCFYQGSHCRVVAETHEHKTVEHQTSVLPFYYSAADRAPCTG